MYIPSLPFSLLPSLLFLAPSSSLMQWSDNMTHLIFFFFFLSSPWNSCRTERRRNNVRIIKTLWGMLVPALCISTIVLQVYTELINFVNREENLPHPSRIQIVHVFICTALFTLAVKGHRKCHLLGNILLHCLWKLHISASDTEKLKHIQHSLL